MIIEKPEITSFEESQHDHSNGENGGLINSFESISGVIFGGSGELFSNQIMVYGYGYGYDGWTNVDFLDYLSIFEIKTRDELYDDFNRTEVVEINGNVTIQEHHLGKLLRITGESTVTLLNSISDDFEAAIQRVDASAVTTLSAEGTLQARGTLLSEQWASCFVKKINATTWTAIGDLTSA